MNEPLEDMDRASLFHPFTAISKHNRTGPKIICEASGVRLKDSEGKSYIDSLGGLWCVNVGYGRKEIANALARQSKRLSFYHTFGSMTPDITIQLADRVVSLAPEPMSHIIFGTSGSDANDTNIKLIWLYNNLLGRPAKKKIITRARAYHGTTTAVTTATALPTVHQAFDLPVDRFRRTSAACYYWRSDREMTEEAYTDSLLSDLNTLIENEGPGTIAAFMAEPIAGAGGVLVPPKGYWEGVQKILKKHDILLLVDEVITAFGRTGNMFGCDTYDIQPDLMTIAKGLTSGYVPMSGSLISEEIWNVFLDAYEDIGVFGHGLTYSGHPLGAAAGMANLDIFANENLIEQARETGDYLQMVLKQEILTHRLIGDVRGCAMIAGIEIDPNLVAARPDTQLAPRVSEICYQLGLVIRPLMDCNVLAIAPPLIISKSEIDEMISILKQALDRV